MKVTRDQNSFPTSRVKGTFRRQEAQTPAFPMKHEGALSTVVSQGELCL